MILPLLALALLEGVSMAPVMLKEATMIGETAITSETELYEILKKGLLNDPENLQKMGEKFTFSPNEQKLCIHVNYTIICTGDQEERCDNSTSYFNCSALTPLSINSTWLSFDSSTLTGGLLIWYAYLDLEMLGLNWGGACDLSPEATLYLSINVPSLLFLCDANEMVLLSAIESLTEQVSVYYAH